MAPVKTQSLARRIVGARNNYIRDCSCLMLFQVFYIQFKLCLLMHLIHTGRCPSYISETVQLVADNAGRAGLRSASTSRYILPRLRTVFGERAFSFSGPKAWNALPGRFHSIESTDSFKKQLKTFLFNHSV